MRTLITSTVLLYLIACGEEKTQEADKGPEIYPVSSFFTEEIKAVDSFKLPTVMIRTIDGKSDTSSISMDEFKTIAREFLLSDISDPSLRNHYKESSFADQSVPSITFSYSTDRNNLEVRRMDIILKPDPVANDKVRTVYIEKTRNDNDTIISKKLYWKSQENFQIITSSRHSNQPEKITRVKVTWNGFD